MDKQKAKLGQRPKLDIRPETHMEHPDQQPLALPMHAKIPESLQTQIQRMVKRSFEDYARATGQETFDESQDFDIEDETDPNSPYETFFDPVLKQDITLDDFNRNAEAYKNRFIRSQAEYYEKMDEDNAIARNLHRHYNRKDPQDSAQPSGSSDPPDSLKPTPAK